jgi:hypothetical protein
MSYREEFETFELRGLTFRAYTSPDDSGDAPWENSDCHGPVREVENNWRRAKKAGERVMHATDWHAWLYDWQAAMKIARRDGWGLNPEARAALAAKLGREPTRGEVCAESVRRDYEHLRAWCRGDWWYVGVIVELLDIDDEGTGEDGALWGTESNAVDHLGEVARDLAGEIASRLNLDKGAGRRRKTFKRTAPARSEVIHVRA